MPGIPFWGSCEPFFGVMRRFTADCCNADSPPSLQQRLNRIENCWKRVVFVDLDPQGTLRGWWTRRTEGVKGDPNPGLATPSPANLPQALRELDAAGIDLCVIDTPPSVHPFLAATMKLADLILLPTRPTTDDLDALPAVLDLVEDSGRPVRIRCYPSPAG